MPNRALTELEGVVLGLVWERGPCTGYAVRKVFLDSSNPHWSASRGAIYPLLERLAEDRLVVGRRENRGRRSSRRFAITATGRAALMEWVDRPQDARLLAAPPDPLRTRLPFLGVLPGARRERLLLALREGVAEQVARFGSDGDVAVRRADSTENRLLVEGVRLALEARLTWLDALLVALAEERNR